MDTRTEPIRQDIDNLRESMTDKMGQIEAKIKGTVDDTTETLKRGLDVKYQVSEHPWTALGVAVLAGYALGSMGGNDSKPSTYRYRSDFRHQDARPGEPMRYYDESEQRNQDWGKSQNASYSASSSPSRNENAYRSDFDYRDQKQSSSGGFVDDVVGQLGVELDTLKTAAISSLVNLLRDTVKQNLPGVYSEAERLRGGSTSSNSGSSFGSNATNGPSYPGNTSSYSAPSNPSQSYTSNSASSTGLRYTSPSSSAPNSGEGEFYREADITEGRTNRYQRTSEIYPAGSSESDTTPSTQREVGSNPNYDMVPPAPHANPDGRP